MAHTTKLPYTSMVDRNNNYKGATTLGLQVITNMETVILLPCPFLNLLVLITAYLNRYLKLISID